MASARAGVTSIEYVSVCAMLCLVVVSAVGVLGESLGGIDGVASVMGAPNQEQGATNNAEAGQVIEASSKGQHSSKEVSHLQLFSVVSSLCLVGLGILHLSRSSTKKSTTAGQTCEVAQVQLQTKALKSVLNKRNSVRSTMLQDWVHLFEGEAVVGTYMSRDVASVDLDMPTEEADQMLRDDGYRRVMVTHADGRMAGVLSRKDIATKRGKLVRNVMTSAPKTAAPEMSLRIALSVLLQHRISCLPVVKNEKLVGLLSTSDLLIVLQCILLTLSNNPGGPDSDGQ